MEKVTAYQARDGTLLASPAECTEYELSLIWRERIAEFIASPFNRYHGPTAGIAKAAILAWENFKTASPIRELNQ